MSFGIKWEPMSLGFSFIFNQVLLSVQRYCVIKYLDFSIQDMASLKRQVMRITKLRKVSTHVNANHFYANVLILIKQVLLRS